MKQGMVVNATPGATPLAADLSLEEAAALAASAGFDGVELAVANPVDVDVPALKAMLANCRLEVAAIGTGAAYREGLSLSHPDPSRRAGATARLKAHVELGAALGAAVIVGLIRGRASDGLGRDDAIGRTTEHLREVAACAAPLGVRLLLEPINRYETDIINTIEEALGVAEAAGDNVGLLIDTFHMNIEERCIAESIRAAGSRVWHVHVADSNRLAPGLGHLDFQEVVKALRDVGYDGYLSAEILHRPDARAAFAATYTHLAPLLGMGRERRA